MSSRHARSRPGRAVLLLAVAGLTPPTLLLSPRVSAAPTPVSVPDTGVQTHNDAPEGRRVGRSRHITGRPDATQPLAVLRQTISRVAAQ